MAGRPRGALDDQAEVAATDDADHGPAPVVPSLPAQGEQQGALPRLERLQVDVERVDVAAQHVVEEAQGALPLARRPEHGALDPSRVVGPPREGAVARLTRSCCGS